MSLKESNDATWNKRYKQKHYGYRDSLQQATAINTEAGALGLFLQALGQGVTPNPAYCYIFGTNARAKINPVTGLMYGLTNWPDLCYAREILFTCDQAVLISIISMNPEYIRQAVAQGYTKVTPTVFPFIFEEPQLIPANTLITFYPTLGYAVLFWFVFGGTSGNLNVMIEGNVEGTD